MKLPLCRHYFRHAWTESLHNASGEYRKCLREGCGVIQRPLASRKTRISYITGLSEPINVRWVYLGEMESHDRNSE